MDANTVTSPLVECNRCGDLVPRHSARSVVSSHRNAPLDGVDFCETCIDELDDLAAL